MSSTGPAVQLGPWHFGELLADPAWLQERIADAGRFWRTSDRGIRATLWWYSASVVLLGPAVHALATSGRGLSLAPEDVRFTLTDYGYPERVAPAIGARDVAPGPQAFAQHLDDALARILMPLSEVGEVPIQRLWALTSDSLGNRLLAERRTGLAGEIAAASAVLRPAPRYVAIDAGPDRPPATYLRRASCCMIFRVQGQGLCVSCPRQPPAERQARLEAYAQTFG